MAELIQTITASLPVSKWNCLLLRIVLQDALTEVTLTLKVLVDDITAFMSGRNKELVVDGRQGSEEAENGGGGEE